MLRAVRRARGAAHDDDAARGDTLEQGALQLGAAHRNGGHRGRTASAAQRLRRREGSSRRLEVGHRDYMVFLIRFVLRNANFSSISASLISILLLWPGCEIGLSVGHSV